MQPFKWNQRRDLTDRTFGRLVVIRFARYQKSGGSVWLCKCECGKEVEVRRDHLTSGKTKSCSCLHKEIVGKLKTTHGMHKSKEYKAWQHMRERCDDPNHPSFDRYGGRGITVCERWHKFENFFEDMGVAPLGYELDREKNDEGYDKGNCRWVTHKVNSRNKSCDVRITYNGVTKTWAEWADEAVVCFETFKGRIRKGWSMEAALTLPAQKGGLAKWRTAKKSQFA